MNTEIAIPAGPQAVKARVQQIASAWVELRAKYLFHHGSMEAAAKAAEAVIGNCLTLESAYKFDQALTSCERNAWRCILEESGVRGFLSVRRQQQLEQSINTGYIEHGMKMPPLTPESAVELFASVFNRADELGHEMLREVFDWLVPRNGWVAEKYKSNNKRMVGKKAIRPGVVSASWPSTWHVDHYRTEQVDALDRVFHTLDGRAMEGTPLRSAIGNVPTHQDTATTDYFRVKMFKNGAAHIYFLRMDLVDKLNALAGGAELTA